MLAKELSSRNMTIVEDDEVSMSSSSSESSEESEATSVAESVNEIEADDPCEKHWRQGICCGLVSIGIIVLFTTVILVVNQDYDHFDSSFDNFVSSLKEAAALQDRGAQASLESMSESVTMQAVNEGSKWPYVLSPYFNMQAKHVHTLAPGAESVMLSPIVTEAQRNAWEKYSVLVGNELSSDPSFDATAISPSLYWIDYDINGTANVSTEVGPGPYNPVWQWYPPLSNSSVINYEMLSNVKLQQLFYAMLDAREAVVSPIMSSDPVIFDEDTYEDAKSVVYSPIFQDLSESNSTEIVANLALIVSWEIYLSFLTHNHMQAVEYVVQNSCGQSFTIDVQEDGSLSNFTVGDHHDDIYQDMVGVVPLLSFMKSHYNYSYDEDGDNTTTTTTVVTTKSGTIQQACAYELRVYPTQQLRNEYKSKTVGVTSGVIVASFLVILFLFWMRDAYYRARKAEIVKSVEKSNAIIASLFPSTVRDRLFGDGNSNNDGASQGSRGSRSRRSFGFRLRNYLTEGEASGEDADSPIADLFPECTVLFADIVGFTAWSSMREPTQVFTLLETLYGAFDELAKELGVFKVETIGDCYVAVTGLPDPREDHAVVMAIFAKECLKKMQALTKDLEVKLGPDTGDLSMRFGLHSGPVTAGVLRGERSRFQLFGDTVNTAARIESTGQRGRIHLSEECAQEIMKAQKAHWVQPREDKVTAKGKGELTTFWLMGSGPSSVSSGTSSHVGNLAPVSHVADKARAPLPKIMRKKKVEKAEKTAQSEAASKVARLVDWNVDILQRLLKQVEARRRSEQARKDKGLAGNKKSTNPLNVLEGAKGDVARKSMDKSEDFAFRYVEPQEVPHLEDPSRIYTDEVKEVIKLPDFDRAAFKKAENPDSIDLGSDVVDQLHDYVMTISSYYNENSFHNFEHASHVTMSVVKLLSRIVAPDIEYEEGGKSDKKRNQALAAKLHDHTYGITSDPLTQFAVVFSALIHDVDHRGIPNTQLNIEEPELAERFRGESTAEQNSVAISWDLLMDPQFKQLRRAIYGSETERERFLQLIINCVMATDIVNPELKKLRNARWDKAFKVGASGDEEDINRKATIVMEHLIQASDVSHTMQHWHIYRKWNERLFVEMYTAFKTGRSSNNPADFWAKGEVGFFDFYIIPLAKKLKDCGVFGVSSDEYLQYAVKNRNEWEAKGADIVQGMVEKIELEYD